MQRLKLMGEYGRTILWGLDLENLGPVEPEELDLSTALCHALMTWAEWYDSFLDSATGQVRQVTPGERHAFEREGLELWRRLRQELAGRAEVSYFSELTHSEHPNPSSYEAARRARSSERPSSPGRD